VRQTLRVLLGGWVALAGATAALVLTPATAGAGSIPAAPITATQVCGLVSPNEVLQLLNYVPAISPGSPQPRAGGGACAWGTGMGETVGVSVGGYPSAFRLHPCRGSVGSRIAVGHWQGCASVSFANGESMTGFEGPYSVSIEPEVNVIGLPYQSAEEAVISRVFRELHA